jgi:hypothetical protein
MKARLLLNERRVISDSAFIEMFIWQVPKPVPGGEHFFKYRLALVIEGVCILRYDNEAGKGDHKHVAGKEVAYRFSGLSALMADFWDDVENWRDGNEDGHT